MGTGFRQRGDGQFFGCAPGLLPRKKPKRQVRAKFAVRQRRKTGLVEFFGEAGFSGVKIERVQGSM